MIDYLVQYGTLAFVGRFSSADEFARDEAVVIRSPRGIETGVVLRPADRPIAHAFDAESSGELLRKMTSADHELQQSLNERLQLLLQDAEAILSEQALPVSLVDAEWLLEGDRVILHLLPWHDTDVTAFTSTLSQKHHIDLRVYDLRQSPTPDTKEPGGCGKPGCGSSGGGCSTGGCGSGGGCGTSSCSKGAMKNADELTGYFTQLREKMEEQSRRRTALH